MPNNSVMGFDFGKKRIGVAIGQPLTNTATPLGQVEQGNWKAIGNLIDEWQPETFVVGLPLNMDDTPSPLSKAATKFSKELQKRFDKSTQTFDERLSSREAIARLEEQGKTRPSKAEINGMAAAIIVESWLNAQT